MPHSYQEGEPESEPKKSGYVNCIYPQTNKKILENYNIELQYCEF